MSAKLLAELISAPVRIAGAAAEVWTDYALATWSDPAAPFRVSADLMTWWNARTQRTPPHWAHDALVVRHWPLARLRDYSNAPRAAATPTLVLPPQAGHHSCIVDYAPGQSQLLTLREAGLDRLYCLDWAGATDRTADASIEDHLRVLSDAVELICPAGGRVNLVGDCQGGWLATIFAALHPERIESLTVAGAPIDFHAGQAPLLDWTRLLGAIGRRSGVGAMAGYRAMVALGGGVQRGANQLLGFKTLEPTAEWERDLALLANIRDPGYVARYRQFADWFEWTQDIPGAYYLWIVEHLFQNNELVSGELVVGGRKVDLGAIDCPLFLVAGTEDHITPAEQVWALAEHVGTPFGSVHRELVRGGHLGLFMGREALREHWSPIAARIHAGPRRHPSPTSQSSG